MANSKRKRVPQTVLKLPDLEQSKSAVLNSPTSAPLRACATWLDATDRAKRLS
jgi:hypothetical protein